MGLGVECSVLAFQVQGSGLEGESSGFRVWDSGLRVSKGLRVYDLKFRV